MHKLVAAASLGALALGWFACVGDSPAGNGAGVDAGGGGSGGSSGGSSGSSGQLDSGTLPDGQSAATLLDGVLFVTAGDFHTCALDTAGSVLCWGGNGSGQLGKSPVELTRSSLPVRVELGGIAKSIAAGAAHTCAVLEDDVVKCWGKNEQSQCGRSPAAPYVLPDVVLAPESGPDPSLHALNVVAGGNNTCALASAAETSLLDDARKLYCWGDNLYGQAGIPATQFPQAKPILIPYDRANLGNGDMLVNAAAVAPTFTCSRTFIFLPSTAVVKDVVRCSGSNFGGTRMDAGAGPDPVVLANGSGDYYASVGAFALGETHGCMRFPDAMAADAPAFGCFGGNDRGQGGTSSSTRLVRPVEGIVATAVTDVAARGKVTCVIENNAARCFGDNRAGQLGRGTVDDSPHPEAVSVVDLAPQASQLALGGTHACVVLGGGPGQAGQVACWGSNASGQLGDGSDLTNGYLDVPAAERTLRSRPVFVHSR